MGFSAGHGSGAGAGGSPEGPSAADATRPCGASPTQSTARSASVPQKDRPHRRAPPSPHALPHVTSELATGCPSVAFEMPGSPRQASGAAGPATVFVRISLPGVLCPVNRPAAPCRAWWTRRLRIRPGCHFLRVPVIFICSRWWGARGGRPAVPGAARATQWARVARRALSWGRGYLAQPRARRGYTRRCVTRGWRPPPARRARPARSGPRCCGAASRTAVPGGSARGRGWWRRRGGRRGRRGGSCR
jgi:hypothetical protein